MTSASPRDTEAREAIRNNLDVTMLVEAAAGTGKTTSLVGRMVNLVRTGRARASTIAAITFTVKAAAHLREAFQEALEREIRTAGGSVGHVCDVPHPGGSVGHVCDVPHPHGSTNDGTSETCPTAGETLSSALDEIDRGFIGTTHAFCARLLRERPVEAGLDPEFRELDEASARALTEDFWNRWYEAESLGGGAMAGRLAQARELALDRKTLRNAFTRIVEHPDVTLVSQETPRPDLARVTKLVVEFLDLVEPHLPTDAHRDEPDDFEWLIVGLIRRRRSADLEDPLEQFFFLDEANHASRKPVQKRWPDGKTAKKLGETYSAIVTDEIRPALRQWREHAHGIALDILRSAATAFAQERRRNGTLTFPDLLVCARDLLRDHAQVRRYFQRRFTHLLVDEFQDTDPLQAEVLFYLTGEEVEEKSWRELRPRPGSLFIVGDPKQSIYRFRRADITTYLDVKNRIESSGGMVLQLSRNFRSLPAICEFVNESFPTLFDSAAVDEGRQARHIDLEPARLAADAEPSLIRASAAQGSLPFSTRPRMTSGVFSLEMPDAKANVVAAGEALCVARWIRQAIENRFLIDEGGVTRPLRFSDILLVSFQRPRLAEYARVFESEGIPYDITGSKAFKSASELAIALPLLRAVIDPDDEVSIVAFLRGPLCGADDDALYRFVRGGGRFTPFQELPAGTDERIRRGLDALRETIRDAREHPPAATMARLFDRMALLPLAATQTQAGTRSGNLYLALTIARTLSSRGESLADIVEHLEALLTDPPEIEELDVDPGREEAVRLMNLHQVKGLEAPVVFLIDPADERDFDIELYVDRSGEESLGHFVVSKKWGKGTKDLGLPVGWEAFKQREKAFKDAEKRRLLYVAATRARNVLVIGFRQTSKGLKGAWRELASRVRDRLAIPPAADRHRPDPRAAAMQFEEVRADVAERFASGRRPSYSVLPVTKIAHAEHAELVRAEEGLGKGTSWGRVLHRLFEAMLRDETLDIAHYAGNLLKDEERDPVELDEVMRVVDAVRSSPLWSRIKAADERFVEIPFALNVARRAVGLDEEGDTLLHGTIDLVFREGDRWFIVDYKSDSTAGRLEWLVTRYKPQVEHYARFWSQITGRETTAGLFFVDGCVERWV